MARKVQQFRFYGDAQDRRGYNYPEGINGAKMRSGSIFSSYMPVIQLGIQAPPGTKFYLNGGIDPVIIGQTGIYELNVDNWTEITKLSFDITSINLINNSPQPSSIMVDILYESY